jgi:hypothetical protein
VPAGSSEGVGVSAVVVGAGSSVLGGGGSGAAVVAVTAGSVVLPEPSSPRAGAVLTDRPTTKRATAANAVARRDHLRSMTETPGSRRVCRGPIETPFRSHHQKDEQEPAF